MTRGTSLRLLLAGHHLDEATAILDELRRCGYDLDWHRAESLAELRNLLDARPELVVADERLCTPGAGTIPPLEEALARGAAIVVIVAHGAPSHEVVALRAAGARLVPRDSVRQLGPVVGGALEAAQAARSAAMRHALECEKQAALARLAAAVVHEVNNAVQGLSVVVPSLEPVSPEDGAIVGDVIDRLRHVSEDLVLVARRRPPRPEPADLNAIVRQAVGELGRALGSATVEFAPGAGLPVVPLCQEQMRELCANLILHVSEGANSGVVTVRTSYDDGEHVTLSVSGDDRLLSTSERLRAFEPRVGRALRGPGMRLHAVWAIACAHGGRVDISGAPGGANTYVVKLPRHPGATITRGSPAGVSSTVA